MTPMMMAAVRLRKKQKPCWRQFYQVPTFVVLEGFQFLLQPSYSFLLINLLARQRRKKILPMLVQFATFSPPLVVMVRVVVTPTPPPLEPPKLPMVRLTQKLSF